MRKKVIEKEKINGTASKLESSIKTDRVLKDPRLHNQPKPAAGSDTRERKVQVIENTISAFFSKHATSQLQPRTLEVECFLPLGVEVVVSATVVVVAVVVNVVFVCVVMGGENTNGK